MTFQIGCKEDESDPDQGASQGEEINDANLIFHPKKLDRSFRKAQGQDAESCGAACTFGFVVFSIYRKPFHLRKERYPIKMRKLRVITDKDIN